VLKCANCKENHKANSNICEFPRNQQKKPRQSQQSAQNSHEKDTEMQNTAGQLVGVVITNDNKW